MIQKRMRVARANGTTLETTKLTGFDPDNTQTVPSVQVSYLAARFGLDATRAKLTAELCWRRS